MHRMNRPSVGNRVSETKHEGDIAIWNPSQYQKTGNESFSLSRFPEVCKEQAGKEQFLNNWIDWNNR